jgi:hypothetical protein
MGGAQPHAALAAPHVHALVLCTPHTHKSVEALCAQHLLLHTFGTVDVRLLEHVRKAPGSPPSAARRPILNGSSIVREHRFKYKQRVDRSVAYR